ncbi:MAG: hypothetical protein ACXW30_03355 [Micavibrio sp.]
MGLAKKPSVKALFGFAAAASLLAALNHNSDDQKYGPDGYPLDTPSASESIFKRFSFNAAPPLTPEEAEIEALVSDDLMDRVAHSESSGQADATNPDSTATGKFQFIESTFLEQLYKHGESLGYGHLSRHIEHSETGRGASLRHHYTVADRETRSMVLDARNDPVLSEELAKAYMRDNLLALNDILPDRKIPMSEALAYMTHHFGVGGTVEIVEALEENPSTSFRSVAGAPTCNSNEAICFKPNGKPRTVAEVHRLLETKLASAPS